MASMRSCHGTNRHPATTLKRPMQLLKHPTLRTEVAKFGFVA